MSDITTKINNELTRGDTYLSVDTNSALVVEGKKRNKILHEQKTKLENEIAKKQKIIERIDRDFSDARDQVNHPQPTKKLLVLEDYTLALLCISYLFMVLTFIYYYTSISLTPMTGFMQSLIGSVFVTMCFVILMYYIV
jgi:hypothetical protein